MRHPPRKIKLCSKQHLLHRSQLPFLDKTKYHMLGHLYPAISHVYPHIIGYSCTALSPWPHQVLLQWPHLILSFRRGGSILLYRLTLKAVDGRGNATRKEGEINQDWLSDFADQISFLVRCGQKSEDPIYLDLRYFFINHLGIFGGQPYNSLDDPIFFAIWNWSFTIKNHVTIDEPAHPFEKMGDVRWFFTLC